MAVKLLSSFEKQLHSHGIQYTNNSPSVEPQTYGESEKHEPKPLNIKISFSAKKANPESD